MSFVADLSDTSFIVKYNSSNNLGIQSMSVLIFLRFTKSISLKNVRQIDVSCIHLNTKFTNVLHTSKTIFRSISIVEKSDFVQSPLDNRQNTENKFLLYFRNHLINRNRSKQS